MNSGKAEGNYFYVKYIVKIGPRVDLKSIPDLCAKLQHAGCYSHCIKKLLGLRNLTHIPL
jgi:hypothetical protein